MSTWESEMTKKEWESVNTVTNSIRRITMSSMWEHEQDVALYKRDIEKLQDELQKLKEIEEEHRKLNGALRTELFLFYKEKYAIEGFSTYDDFPNECILCGTRLKDIDNGF